MSQLETGEAISKPATGKSKAQRIAAGGGLLALAVLAVVDVIRGPWDHDAGYYLFRSSLVAGGWRPYLDYESFKPPLMDVLNALPMIVGVDRLWLAVAIPVAWIVLNALTSIALLRNLGYGWTPALLAGMGFLILSIQNGGNHLTLEHGVVLFSMLSLIAITGRTPLTSRQLFLCGLAVACATLSKQNGLVVVLPAAALLFERRRELGPRAVWPVSIGLTLPVLSLLVWLDFSFDRIYHNMVERLLTYTDASADEGISYLSEYLYNTPTAAFLTLALIAGITGVASGPRRLLIGASLIGAVLQFLPRLIRNYQHYTLNVWPFGLLVIVLACSARPEGARRLLKAATVSILIVSSLLMFLGQSLSRWSGPGMLLSTFKPAADVIRESSGPDDRIRLYAAEPIVPYLANRLPDEVNTPLSALAGGWDGSHRVGDPLPQDGPIVLVDTGGDWVAPLRELLARAGFGIVFDTQPHQNYRLTVYDRERSDRR